jgi:rhodanese-related sulfurtransferase
MSSGNETLPIEIDCRQLRSHLDADDDVLVVDCRERDEYAVVNLSQATLLPMSELVDRIAELEPHREQRIVVHCHHGGRSLRVANWLRENGFPQAQSLAGGIDQWSVEIDPSLPRY